MKHNLLKITFVLAAVLLLAACASNTPAPQPTAAPAQPTAAPAQPTAAPAQPTAAPAQPTQASSNLPDDMKPLAQPYKIKIAIVNNLFGTVFWSAIEKGFFQKHGISAQAGAYATGQDAAKALTTNDAQVGTSAMNNYQTEMASGVQHMGLFTSMGNGASLINDKPLAIIAGPSSGIRAGHPEDLKGKTIGTSLGGTAELYLRAVLRKAGVDAKDVKMVNVPQGNSVTVLKNKDVDAVSMWEPYNTMMLKGVPGSVEVSRAGGYFGYVIFGLMEPKMVQENPDLALRVVAAYSEAAAWVRQNPTDAGVVASHWIQGLDPAVAAEGLKNVDFDPRITTITQKAWDLSNQLLMTDGKLKSATVMQGNFDTSFLAKVMKDHPEYFKDLAAADSVSIK